MHPRFRRALFWTLPLVLALSCSGSGLSGPDYTIPGPSTGPCFEADLSDGLNSGSEFLKIFDCLNHHGAFDDFAPLAVYLASEPRVDDISALANGSMGDFDLAAILRIASNLLTSKADPLNRALGLYTEIYDLGLLPPLLDVLREATDTMVACEESAEPWNCSLLRMMRAQMDTDNGQWTANVLDAVLGAFSDEDIGGLIDSVARLLGDEDDRRQLLDLLELMFPVEAAADPGEENTLRPLLLDLLDDEALFDDLASHLALLWRDGALGALGDDLEYVFSHDSAGNFVGLEGNNIIDELLGGLSIDFDPALLREEFALPGEPPTTLIELVLDTTSSLYLNDASITDIVTEIEDVTDSLCGGAASSALCDLMAGMLPPVIALIETTNGIPNIILPVLYVVDRGVQTEQLLDLLEAMLAPADPAAEDVDMYGSLRFMLVFAVEEDLIDRLLPVLPELLNTEVGMFKPAVYDALELVRATMTELEIEEGHSVFPSDLPGPLVAEILQRTRGSLDTLLGQVGDFLVDEESPLDWDNLIDLFADVTDAMAGESLGSGDGLATFLDNEEAWTAALRILADRNVRELLTPTDAPQGPTWYIYDLIDREVTARILSFVADILDMLGSSELFGS